jgi:peptidoglycan/xylan/chitin deacetylase (PgdA/CDA1 family)
MPFFKKKKFYKILFSGFIAGFFVAAILLFLALKFFSPKKLKVHELDPIAPYSVQKTFKPEDLKSPVLPYSRLTKKSYRIPVITYHYVENVKDQKDTIRKGLNIPPFVFDKELEAISKSNYQMIFVKDIPKIISGEIPYSTRSAALTFDDGYEDFYTDAFPLLKKYNIKATVFIINDFIGRKGFMNEKQIKEIIDSHLVEVGAHTLDHLYLKLLTKNIVIKQVFESKKALEEMFKIKIESFAYPYGAFDQNTIDIVRGAGYTSAVSEITDDIQSNTNVFYLSRIRAGNFSYGNVITFLEKFKK